MRCYQVQCVFQKDLECTRDAEICITEWGMCDSFLQAAFPKEMLEREKKWQRLTYRMASNQAAREIAENIANLEDDFYLRDISAEEWEKRFLLLRERGMALAETEAGREKSSRPDFCIVRSPKEP